MQVLHVIMQQLSDTPTRLHDIIKGEPRQSNYLKQCCKIQQDYKHCLNHCIYIFYYLFIGFSFFRGGDLGSSPYTQLEDDLLSVVGDCLFNTFAFTLDIWRPLLHPQPENAPYRCDRNPLPQDRNRWWAVLNEIMKLQVP